MKKCKKCGNNFTKDDFSKLKYKQEFSGHFTDELDLFDELTICPDCLSKQTHKDTTRKQGKRSNE